MQLNFAANSYTDDFWRDLKNDVHVGWSKNCNLECTLTLVNTFLIYTSVWYFGVKKNQNNYESKQ